jgi:hypothetical protein
LRAATPDVCSCVQSIVATVSLAIATVADFDAAAEALFVRGVASSLGVGEDQVCALSSPLGHSLEPRLIAASGPAEPPRLERAVPLEVERRE